MCRLPHVIFGEGGCASLIFLCGKTQNAGKLMRRISFTEISIASVRIALVVAGMLSVVAMMGATAKQASPAKPAPVVASSAPLHGSLRLNERVASPMVEEKDTELLHDVSDNFVGQAEPRVRQVTMEVTAYCACVKCCGPNAAGITASGHDTSYNNSLFVAADPRLPFGTKVLIPGYSDLPVEVIDRGSAIRGDKIDVFFPSHDDAIHWGRRQLLVTIVE